MAAVAAQSSNCKRCAICANIAPKFWPLKRFWLMFGKNWPHSFFFRKAFSFFELRFFTFVELRHGATIPHDARPYFALLPFAFVQFNVIVRHFAPAFRQVLSYIPRRRRRLQHDGGSFRVVIPDYLPRTLSIILCSIEEL